MLKHKHSFTYYFAWLAFGSLIGMVTLLIRGDISLTMHSTKPTEIPGATDITTTSQNWQRGFSEAVIKAAPAVVSIKAITWTEIEAKKPTEDKIFQKLLGKQSPHLSRRKAESEAGSGVILQSNGYIVTNYHVIANSDEIYVRLKDGRKIRAQLIGSDPDTDLSILKIEPSSLPALIIADINQIKVGDIVLAIGDPFAIGQTVTQGIISATGSG